VATSGGTAGTLNHELPSLLLLLHLLGICSKFIPFWLSKRSEAAFASDSGRLSVVIVSVVIITGDFVFTRRAIRR
jgi:hypothetical protein